MQFFACQALSKKTQTIFQRMSSKCSFIESVDFCEPQAHSHKGLPLCTVHVQVMPCDDLARYSNRPSSMRSTTLLSQIPNRPVKTSFFMHLRAHLLPINKTHHLLRLLDLRRLPDGLVKHPYGNKDEPAGASDTNANKVGPSGRDLV